MIQVTKLKTKNQQFHKTNSYSYKDTIVNIFTNNVSILFVDIDVDVVKLEHSKEVEELLEGENILIEYCDDSDINQGNYFVKD